MTEVITSKDNEKLKLVRKLQQRRHRDREGLFVTEGEDLLEAGVAAGVEPVAVLTLEGEGLGGEEVSGDALASVSTLGSGTRAIARVAPGLGAAGGAGRACTSTGSGDPGNVGAIVRTANALVTGTVVLGPDCADPYWPKAVRATMGSIFAQPLGARRASRRRRAPSRARSPTEASDDWRDRARAAAPSVCLGSEREGLPGRRPGIAATPAAGSRSARAAAESLNVAAAAAIATPAGIDRAPGGGCPCLSGFPSFAARQRTRSPRPPTSTPSRSCACAISGARPS